MKEDKQYNMTKTGAGMSMDIVIRARHHALFEQPSKMLLYVF